MEKSLVLPPQDLQASMLGSYIWAQRPVEFFADSNPELWFAYHKHPIACNPDGSLLNRYEGMKEMFEGQGVE